MGLFLFQTLLASGPLGDSAFWRAFWSWSDAPLFAISLGFVAGGATGLTGDADMMLVVLMQIVRTRHTFLSSLGRNGRSSRFCQKVLGHRNLAEGSWLLDRVGAHV